MTKHTTTMTEETQLVANSSTHSNKVLSLLQKKRRTLGAVVLCIAFFGAGLRMGGTTTTDTIVTIGPYSNDLHPNIPLPLDPTIDVGIPPSPTDRSCFGPEDCAGHCNGPEDCKISFQNPPIGNFPTSYGLDHALCIDNACQSGHVGAKCRDAYFDCIPPPGLSSPVCFEGECRSGQAGARCEERGGQFECIAPLKCKSMCRHVTDCQTECHAQVSF